MNSKLPLDGCVYMLTVGRVLTTSVFQSNLGQGATLKVRLGSCLSLPLKWTASLDCTKINAHFQICLWEGLIHEWKHALLAPYVGKQFTALFHTKPLLTSLVYTNVAPTMNCIF